MWVRLSPPSRKRQGGVKRVPQALQACILTVTCFTSTRLPGRTEARQIGANENPQRVEDTLWIECVGDAQVVVSPALSIGDA